MNPLQALGINEWFWLGYARFRCGHELAIRTHFVDREKVLLMNLARMQRGQVYVEIGSYHGSSACFIAHGIRLSAHSRGARLYCIDTWMNDAMTEGQLDTYQQFKENVSSYDSLIVPVRALSVDAAASFSDQVDFLFVDGDHSYDGVSTDLRAWLPKLAPGALLAMHDYGWAEGVQRAVAELVRPKESSPGRVVENTYWTVL